jgi:hypothetical protein
MALLLCSAAERIFDVESESPRSKQGRRKGIPYLTESFPRSEGVTSAWLGLASIIKVEGNG